ncbi:c-mannosyltransferase dpy-19 [Caerostris extrusa]|uniref:C-mannosyltransferase dpy-19 n=1 Tax=Caerostris extrusa TaxID=172846 RepID=A0AAV4N6B9_CAEEX|nr:c-mannosyltransferase dpy-19 [Caerostris extrusa]
MLVSLLLKCQRPFFSHSVFIAIPTLLFMLSWQFAQFALLTQLLVLFGLYILNFIPNLTFKYILRGHVVILSFEELFKKLNSPIVIMTHIWSILKSKFTSYKDFHTMLYTCAIEFDFLPIETITELIKTPCFAYCCNYCWSYSFLKNDDLCSCNLEILTASIPIIHIRLNGFELFGYSDILYNIFQCLAFFVMAVLVMRLKLFFTPHLCLLASLSLSGKFFRFLDKNELRLFVMVGLLGFMSIQGISNIKYQRNIIGEFSNPDLEELISWVNSTLPEDAVFAGPMPTMANVFTFYKTTNCKSSTL